MYVVVVVVVVVCCLSLLCFVLSSIFHLSRFLSHVRESSFLIGTSSSRLVPRSCVPRRCTRVVCVAHCVA